MSQNIFQIWDSSGRKVPFAVKRDYWSEKYYNVIEKIECEKMPYGKAYGYPTINGEYSNHYVGDSKWNKEKIIPAAGTYQWELVENADLTKYKDGFKAREKTVKGAYTIDSRFFYGKFKGSTVDQVFTADQGYVEWGLINLNQFFLTENAFHYLDKLTNFKFSEKARKAKFEKLELQIKKVDSA